MEVCELHLPLLAVVGKVVAADLRRVIVRVQRYRSE